MNEHVNIWNPQFLQLFMISAILNFGHFMVSALIPPYVEHLGASAAITGTVAGAFAITALAVRPVVGPAIGYFRMNRLFVTAIAIIAGASLCYGLADSVPMLFAGRLLQGVGMGFLAPVSLAMASNALPNHKLASGIGVFSLGQVMATAIGPSAGLSLVHQFGFRAAFVIGAVMIGIALVLALRLKSNRPNRRARFRITLHDMFASEVWVPTVMMFFLAGAYACLQTFILIYGGINGVSEIGLFFTSYAICLLLTRPLSGSIADKYGMNRVIVPGILMFALSFIVISYSHTLPMFLVAGAISAFGYGICQPLIQTLCIQLVSKDRRGVAGNTNYIGVDLGYLLMPTVAGVFVSIVQGHSGNIVLGYEAMFRVMAIPVVVALLVFLWNRRRLTKEGEK